MKIALLGYGNMGKEIEGLVDKAGKHQIVSISLRQPGEKIDEQSLKEVDVVIDFTSPQIVLENIKTVTMMGKNMVVGTTGWYDHLEEVKTMVGKRGTGLIYGQNFSVGANIFFKIVAFASTLFSKFGSYDVYGFEVHHSGKKDSPSGTALKIGSEILAHFPQKKMIQAEKLDRQIKPEELHFTSVRGGRNPGFHQVVFDSAADSVNLSHQAHSRVGFATGAVLAAEFIAGKRGFYNFDQLFDQGGQNE